MLKAQLMLKSQSPEPIVPTGDVQEKENIPTSCADEITTQASAMSAKRALQSESKPILGETRQIELNHEDTENSACNQQ